MKKILATLALSTISLTTLAADFQLDNLSKSDVEDVAREFSGNFAHTTVSAPETDGLWGVEVGVVGGRSKTPDLADVVDSSGGKGSDFENLYHAGGFIRAHIPFDLFAEINVLPERDIKEVTVKNRSLELGWNAGAFFGLPLDIATGFSVTNSEVGFDQDISGTKNNIDLKSKTKILWVGASKSFLFVTPYVKLGTVKADSDLKTDSSIFNYGTLKTSESVTNSGGYLAVGANIQFAFLKFGAEISQIMDVKRASAKFSLDF